MRIYHYTTIDVLALMLKNNTLRLNCLKNVDDNTEGVTTDKGSFKNNIFVSSWTIDDKESIPLWSMYSKNMKGIRIGIEHSNIKYEYLYNNNIPDSIVTNVLPEKNDSIFIQLDSQPCKVDYDLDMTNNELIEEIETGVQRIHFEKIYAKKKNYWSFQQEYRYVLFGCARSKIIKNFPRTDLSHLDVLTSINSHIDCDCNYVDLKLPKEASYQSEITLGPHTDESDQIIVESLVKYFLNDKFTGLIQKSIHDINKKI